MKIKTKILRTILHNGPTSRAKLSKILSYSPSGISEAVSLLIERGVLSEAGYENKSPNIRGRKNILLDIDTSKCFALGIGMSGQTLSAGLATLKGGSLDTKSIEISPGDSPEKIISEAESLCRRVLKDCCLDPKMLLGVGICIDSGLSERIGLSEQTDFSAYPLPVLVEPADDYIRYSAAYMPINPAELYMFGCAKVIRDIFLEENEG